MGSIWTCTPRAGIVGDSHRDSKRTACQVFSLCCMSNESLRCLQDTHARWYKTLEVWRQGTSDTRCYTTPGPQCSIHNKSTKAVMNLQGEEQTCTSNGFSRGHPLGDCQWTKILHWSRRLFLSLAQTRC